MCGRLACGLQPQQVCNSTCYKEKGSNQFTRPQWKDCYNSGKKYKPSFNVCSSDVAPVLISGSHFQLSSRLIVPMLFGVIPQWNQTSAGKYSTINCRVETILSSKLYGNLLKKNQRCVLICNGFYEWQKESGSKKAYFIHGKQPDGVKADEPESWKLEFTPEKGFSGFKPLKLAAVFEADLSASFEAATFSFAVITKAAGPEIQWLHERVPAVLETDEQVDAWLNHEEVTAKLALNYISPVGTFCFYPVSNLVNKVTNNDVSCIKQNKDSTGNNENKKKSATFLKNWLEKGQKRENSEMKGDTTSKVKKNS